MGCSSEYMNPSKAEVNSKKVCELLVFLGGKVGKPVPDWAHKAAGSQYGDPKRLDEATQLLCALCQDVDESVIYNARDPQCRALADWWEEHQAADRAREQSEKEARADRLYKLGNESRLFSDDELASVGLKRMFQE